VPSTGRLRIGVCLCKEQTESPLVRGALIRFCRHLLERLDAELCFVPMQTLRALDDRAAAESVAEQLGAAERVAVVRGVYNAWETFGLLGRMDAIVSMRLHGVIFALAQALPVLGISYMPKVERVFRDIGHLEWQVPLEGLTANGLISAFTPIFDERTAVREELARIRDDLRRGALENFRLFEEHFFSGAARAKLAP
jgi:polysaccharide pyruvyl transferase WcaK-like protein